VEKYQAVDSSLSSKDRAAASGPQESQRPRESSPRGSTRGAREGAPPASTSAGADPAPDVPPQPEPLICANLELRPDERQALIDGRRIELTGREFAVLLTLAEHPDRVLRRAYIYERVWGEKMKYRERAVDVFIRKLRNKLALAAPSWIYIHTHFGLGYRLAPEQLDSRVDLP
jgi:DNA-binding response OmpR family regulator